MSRIGIIGGGASGMIAAIEAARRGAAVTILERRDRPGKKLLATGNGRCNLTNRDFCVSRDYRSHDPKRLPALLEQFKVDDTIRFFREIGVLVTDKNGYLYPRSQQASTILEALLEELKRLKVSVVCECSITGIKHQNRFVVITSQGDFTFDRLILCCGSGAGTKPSEKLGGHELVTALGLKYYEQLPALVQLRCKEGFYKSLAGVRCMARITLNIFGRKGSESFQEYGELQLTDYGISGIPVFQCSRYASAALSEKRRVEATINFLPEIPDSEWNEFCRTQYEHCQGRTALMAACGLVHKKVGLVLLSRCNLKPDEIVGRETKKRIFSLFEMMRELHTEIVGTNPVENAQICMGGISLSELKDDLEVKKIPGLFICGEMLDVDGRCGGYNLQWAWSSGHIAGSAAAGKKDGRT